MDHHDITVLFLGLGVLLAAARIFGEMARRLHQPAVLGEILAGILLGPTLFGTLAPDAFAWIFPQTGNVAIAMSGFTTVAIALFLLIAGMEVDLSTIWRQGRAALTVGVMGIVIPFALGFGAAWAAPRILGGEADADPLIFALFFATALSISALPVIAKTLMDLGLYRTDMGMVVTAAAVLNDLAGWIIFAVILGMIGGHAQGAMTIETTIGLTLGFVVLVLTVGRWMIHKSLPWVQAHTSWPGGVLGFALVLALLGAALTEWIGIHAIFGAFLVGVAMGDSSHLRAHTRSVLEGFISFIFAPLFFASIGLRVNFIEKFDILVVVAVLVIACVGKIGGCVLGARWSGLERRESWAIGFGMNARGAMEIILGLLALQAGIIRERLFVALVIMALVTSAASGTMMQRILRRAKSRRFTDFLAPKSFISRLDAQEREQAIRELSRAAAASAGISAELIQAKVLEREALASTGIANGLAIPHARMKELKTPVVAVGLSERGVDFNASDGAPARMIVLVLTPAHDDGAQLEIVAHLVGMCRNAELVNHAALTAGYTEFLALIRTGTPSSSSMEPVRSA